VLQGKKIPFISYDLASDEQAKKQWRRTAPPGAPREPLFVSTCAKRYIADKQQLPGILVGGRFVGVRPSGLLPNARLTHYRPSKSCEFLVLDYKERTPSPISPSEEAVEYGELDIFLKRNEEWDELLEKAPLPAQAIGVPGANTPMEMTPEPIRTQIIALQQASPLKGKSPPKPVNKIDESTQIDVGAELSGFGLDGVKVTQDELMDMMEMLGLGGEEAEDLVKGLSGDMEQPPPLKPVEKTKPLGTSSLEPASKAPVSSVSKIAPNIEADSLSVLDDKAVEEPVKHEEVEQPEKSTPSSQPAGGVIASEPTRQRESPKVGLSLKLTIDTKLERQEEDATEKVVTPAIVLEKPKEPNEVHQIFAPEEPVRVEVEVARARKKSTQGLRIEPKRKRTDQAPPSPSLFRLPSIPNLQGSRGSSPAPTEPVPQLGKD